MEGIWRAGWLATGSVQGEIIRNSRASTAVRITSPSHRESLRRVPSSEPLAEALSACKGGNPAMPGTGALSVGASIVGPERCSCWVTAVVLRGLVRACLPSAGTGTRCAPFATLPGAGRPLPLVPLVTLVPPALPVPFVPTPSPGRPGREASSPGGFWVGWVSLTVRYSD